MSSASVTSSRDSRHRDHLCSGFAGKLHCLLSGVCVVLFYWWVELEQAFVVVSSAREEQATFTQAVVIGRASWPWSSLVSLGEACVGLCGVGCGMCVSVGVREGDARNREQQKNKRETLALAVAQPLLAGVDLETSSPLLSSLPLYFPLSSFMVMG